MELALTGPVSSKRESESDREERRKRRKSRWASEEDKTFVAAMPTVLPTNLSKEEEEAYLCIIQEHVYCGEVLTVNLQIEEVSRKLRTGELGIPVNPEERSPSPEPIYGSDGKRLNTREYRTRKRLEEERHSLIQRMIKINPDYKPPADYKPPIIRVSDKVMIPQEDHPDINFVGLLIGPRGNTLKSMERETGAKIIIRGKGSVKEGKVGRKDGQPLPGEDEPLHAYVTANNPECVKRAVDKIKEIIRQGVEVPEGQNDLRRMQLRELALLNGTLRENDAMRCTNCGSNEHKSWMCPDKPNVTNSIVCTSCGGAGHIAKDCRQKRPGEKVPPTNMRDKAKIDAEYMSLMAELGEGPPPPQEELPPGVSPPPPPRRPPTGVLFDRRITPKAIAAPPPPQQTPTQLIPNSLPPPPWQPPQQMPPQQMPPAQLNLSQPPPPPWQTQSAPVTMAPPPTMGVPPPPAMGVPPPPNTAPWMNNPPTTIPPPNIPPWQQPSMHPPTNQPPPVFWPQTFGMPPPQPVQPPSTTVDLPNLLSAPPPPPPSS